MNATPKRRGLGRGLGSLIHTAPAEQAGQADPYGDCCVAEVTMTSFNTWQAKCGACAANPGTYAISQPDPAKLVFVGPGNVTAGSRYEAAAAICREPPVIEW